MPVKSPCIGVCSTGIGDTVCRGCKRFSHEVIQWNGYSESERAAVAARLAALLAQVVRDRVQVTDAEQLKQALKRYQVRFDSEADPHCWVLDLLKAGASQIESWSRFGLKLRENAIAETPISLRDQLDQDYYTLSCAHYARYFSS